jgi:hypothetical protein
MENNQTCYDCILSCGQHTHCFASPQFQCFWPTFCLADSPSGPSSLSAFLLRFDKMDYPPPQQLLSDVLQLNNEGGFKFALWAMARDCCSRGKSHGRRKEGGGVMLMMMMLTQCDPTQPHTGRPPLDRGPGQRGGSRGADLWLQKCGHPRGLGFPHALLDAGGARERVLHARAPLHPPAPCCQSQRSAGCRSPNAKGGVLQARPGRMVRRTSALACHVRSACPWAGRSRGSP